MAGNRTNFDQAMGKGHSAAWDQTWDRAIAYYRAALTEFPDDPAALTALGLVLFQIDRLDDALATYQRAAMLTPGDPVAPEKCGEIFERQGRLNEAIQTYSAVADLHLRRRDVAKAIDLWSRIVKLAPDNLNIRMMLVRALENENQPQRAALEYVDLARALQSARELDKAEQVLIRAGQLDPNSPEVRVAYERLRRKQPIVPINRQTRSKTGMLPTLDEEPAVEVVPVVEHHGPQASPMDTAKEVALGGLAEILFEEDTDTSKANTSLSVGALMRGFGSGRDSEGRRAQVAMYLGQAINSQSSGNTEAALSNYSAALDKGFDHPLIRFMIGALSLEQNSPTEALEHLPEAIAREDIKLGALYGLAEAHRLSGNARESFAYFLEAVKVLDMSLVTPDRQDRLVEAYETLAESLSRASEADVNRIIPGLRGFLTGDNWESHARQARQQLDGANDDNVVALADQVAVPEADQVMEAMRRIDDFIRRKLYATAMEEALFALDDAPTYLPIHIRMAEILVAENKSEVAATKYKVIANTYKIRGEAGRAARLLQNALRLNPVDIDARRELIVMLTAQGLTEEALNQHMELASTYYDLADLETARETYEDALKIANQAGARQWSAELLHKLGDIQMQRLAWRDALKIYDQIKALAPEDDRARIALIDLHFRLGNQPKAISELDAYLKIMISQRNLSAPTVVLEELLNTYSDDAALVARVARLYQDQGRTDDAIMRLDQLGDIQLQAGQNDQARETIRQILALRPVDPGPYEQLLSQI